MRTPLNNVFLGLNVVMKQLEMTFHVPKNHPSYACLQDIQASCEVAISILNDMLLYDKIESGILALELAKCSPWSFIKNTITPFFVQVFNN